MKNQDVIVAKTNELLKGHCYDGLRAAAENWLKALGTEGEKEASKAYIDMLEESVMTLDEVITTFEQPFMIEKFGAEMAGQIHDHAAELKANGGKWCDCPACSCGLEILSYKEDMLA